jgi:hypothetical protein
MKAVFGALLGGMVSDAQKDAGDGAILLPPRLHLPVYPVLRSIRAAETCSDPAVGLAL